VTFLFGLEQKSLFVESEVYSGKFRTKMTAVGLSALQKFSQVVATIVMLTAIGFVAAAVLTSGK
jgi:hypothetical protein